MRFAKRLLPALFVSSLFLLGCATDDLPIDDGSETDFDAPAASGTVRDQLWDKFPDQAIESVPAARALWEENEPAAYTLEIGFASIGFLEIEVVDGVPGEPIRTGEIESWAGESLPQTIDEVFDDFDAILEQSFTNPANEDTCQGTFYNMRFNTEVGYPTYYDTLGPCDDGIGVTIRMTPLA